MKSREQATIRYLRALLLAVGGIYASTCLFSFSFLSFLHVKEAALFMSVALAALLACVDRTQIRAAFIFYFPLWLLVTLASIIHLGVVPAHVTSDAVAQTVRWALLLLAPAVWFDLLQESRCRRFVRTSLSASAFLVGTVALVQYAGMIPSAFPEFPGVTQRVYSVFGNQDLLGGYMALALPVCAYTILRSRRLPIPPMLCLALMLCVLALSGSRSAWLAALVGLAVMAPYRRLHPRRAWVMGAIMTVVALACLVFARAETVERVAKTFASGDVGGRARLWFWDGTLRMVAEHPIVGVGPGNYPYWSPLYLGKALDAPGGERHYHNQLLTEHPHSEPLNILAETGLVGAACALWMLWRVLRLRGPEWGGLAALLTFSLFNSTAASPPHTFAGLLFCGMLAARSAHWQEAFQTRPSTRPTAVATAMLCWVLAGFFAWAVLVPSYRLRTAFNTHLTMNIAPSEQYARIVSYPWPNAAAHEHYGMALFDAGDLPVAEREFALALRGIDSGRVHFLRGATLFRLGRIEEAKAEFEACVWRWPDFKPGWNALWRTTPPDEQPELARRARRWGLDTGLGQPTEPGLSERRN